MSPAGKVSGFYREGNEWFCKTTLPSDITVNVDGVKFHLHMFPLISKCGKIANIVKESKQTRDRTFVISLEEFPGGADAFLIAAKFCYQLRVEYTPRNIVTVYCAANYLDMTDDYGEGNLLFAADNYFHKNVLRNWKDCVLALQSCEAIKPSAEELQIVNKCLHSISVMVCTDPSLFGWPMLMYGSLQSPGGSILWNGINTGARIQSSESNWWFEDISYLSVALFKRLIQTMEARRIRPEILVGAIIYYSKKYLPGLGRWQGGQSGKTRTLASLSMTPAAIDERNLLETVEKLLPEKKSKSFCRFLLGLLRVAFILGASPTCLDSLERRIGMQLELATLDSLLMPSYADSDALYNTDCVERIINHFISSEQRATSFSPSSLNLEVSPSSGPLKKVAKLVDGYIAEVASDMNLKPEQIRSLAQSLPESSRSFHDGIYRALDIFLKAHPWLSDKEKEQLCTIIDFQKLSVDACAHASHNQRLPLRIVLQVLFFEQMQLRRALAGSYAFDDGSHAPADQPTGTDDLATRVVRRDGWVTVVRENQVLKVDLDSMRSRVGELEEKFNRMKQKVKRVTRSHSSLASQRFFGGRIGCNPLPRSSNARAGIVESTAPSPRASVEQEQSSRHSRHSKGLSSHG
ncbi:hypothetical protein AgCh_004244 [Apium graveolens]